MSVIYTTTTKTARMNSVVTTIGSSGKLKLFTSGDVLLATFTLASTAGNVTSGILTFNDSNGATAGILSTTAVTDGVAAKASVTTSDDTDVITGLTVGTSVSDLILDNTNLTVGQNITINSAIITHA